MRVAELAKKYYPRLGDKSRLKVLVNARKLSIEEYEEITGEAYSEQS